MRISWNWLQRYIETGLTPAQAADVLTSTGLETESVDLHEPVKGMLNGVIVGKVLECAKHPDADRLTVCAVDLGGNTAQIVCGAPNVAVGQKVLVATVGTTLNFADGTSIVIKKSKIRGQESHGMICAEDELGLGKSHDGIMVLDPSATVGMAAAEHLGLKSDHVLEIGLTPNRTDAMGHLGVARDLRAALVHRTGTPIELKVPSVAAWPEKLEAAPIPVEVKDPFACPRYSGITLTNVRVGPSPEWLREHLSAIGLKPINNVVDVTNFVQHELGQPLHAFDAKALRGSKIVVRLAAEKEAFTTLDEKARVLDAGDLVIADGEAPVCIAGVFGGLGSGVTNTTTTVFLESACFEPGTIRRTARRHGLNTDASFRYERGADPEITIYALKRAALLLQEVAGASITTAIVDVDHRAKHERDVSLTFAEVDQLTGVRIEHDAIVGILELLDFVILDRNTKGLKVKVPGYRVDVHRPADVIEEILRIHGYDQVPVPEHLMLSVVQQRALSLESFTAKVSAHFATRGMREIMTPSLVNGARSIVMKVASETELVAVKNPLSAELDVLRPTMLFGALSALAHNLNRQQRDLRIFESGRTYRADPKGTVETDRMAIAITGGRYRERWRAVSRRTELADVQEEVEGLLARLGMSNGCTWEPAEHAALNSSHALHVMGRQVGVIGEVAPAVLKAHEVGQPVYFAELDMNALLEAFRQTKVSFTEVGRFPAVRRDLSLLLDTKVRFEKLRKISFDAERKLLREVDLFDVYQGDKLPAGKKSYAISFQLQDLEKTLTDEQVEKAMGRIREALKAGVGAEVRS